MPRLHVHRLQSFANARYLHWYDAFRVTAPDLTPAGDLRTTQRLFTSSDRVGNRLYSNMQVPGQLTTDATGYIQHMYAETNAWECDALNEWACATYVTLHVGDRPVRELALSTLLKTGPGERLDEAGDDGHVALTEEARRLQLANLAEAIYDEVKPVGGCHFGELDPGERNRFCSAAATAKSLLMGPTLIIVPPRQNFGVSIDMMSVDAYARLLERVRPGSDGPEPLVWIRLQGFERRDAC